jgi:DnaJ-class molecular chaperone
MTAKVQKSSKRFTYYEYWKTYHPDKCYECKGTGRVRDTVNPLNLYKVDCPKCDGTGNTNKTKAKHEREIY